MRRYAAAGVLLAAALLLLACEQVAPLPLEPPPAPIPIVHPDLFAMFQIYFAEIITPGDPTALAGIISLGRQEWMAQWSDGVRRRSGECFYVLPSRWSMVPPRDGSSYPSRSEYARNPPCRRDR